MIFSLLLAGTIVDAKGRKFDRANFADITADVINDLKTYGDLMYRFETLLNPDEYNYCLFAFRKNGIKLTDKLPKLVSKGNKIYSNKRLMAVITKHRLVKFKSAKVHFRKDKRVDQILSKFFADVDSKSSTYRSPQIHGSAIVLLMGITLREFTLRKSHKRLAMMVGHKRLLSLRGW